MATKRKKPAKKTIERAAILVLDKRIRKLERSVFGEKEAIGFVAVTGDVVEQSSDEFDDVEEMP